ncbi:hypothetical protein [Micromonospora profundi]|uniref:hypothetical protein n=1 Tax=Micromonospora profundi TaxID=1420889 RepID=UPI0038075273
MVVDLNLCGEDWVAEAALFALVADAYREPALREGGNSSAECGGGGESVGHNRAVAGAADARHALLSTAERFGGNTKASSASAFESVLTQRAPGGV